MSSNSDVYLAVDLGASSGRVLGAIVHDNSIKLEEVHRFENGPVRIGKRLHWNLLELWSQIENGLTKAASQYGSRVQSVGVDTWGVDFVLLDKNDDMVGPAFCYRDPRTDGIMDRAFQKISRQDIFSETGLQFMNINSMFQLYSMREEKSPLLDIADKFLMIPDFFHWILSGEKTNERTNASTTQMLRPTDGKWSERLLSALDIPKHLFMDCVEAGSSLGNIRSHIAQRTGLKNVQTIVPATHDTGAAVLAVPVNKFGDDSPKWCYISSGTWSLMGVELNHPNLTKKCLDLNFTNEGGVGGTTRLLKNISGLWPYQQCRASWQRRGMNYSWDQITSMATAAKPLQAVFNADDTSLIAPDDMVVAIQSLLKNSGQRVLEEPGDIARTALESLALRYRICLGWLEQLVGYKIETIHIVGGGVQNKLLCQMTADATNRVVVAGPVEATALGNVLTQLMGTGKLQNFQSAREWMNRSCTVQTYQPQNPAIWDDAMSKVNWA